MKQSQTLWLSAFFIHMIAIAWSLNGNWKFGFLFCTMGWIAFWQGCVEEKKEK